MKEFFMVHGASIAGFIVYAIAEYKKGKDEKPENSYPELIINLVLKLLRRK